MPRPEPDGHSQRESALLALHETARDVAALRDVDQVIEAIVRRARQLLGTDAAYLTAHDPARDEFWVRATEGTISEPFEQIRGEVGDGMCGLILQDKRPHASRNYMNDHRFRHASRMDAGVVAEDIVSLVGVPLIVGDDVIGVLFVADRHERSYTPQEVALLTSLGTHAAVAIENARLFQDMQGALARERAARGRLQAKTDETQAASDAHDQLTALVARGGDLHDLAVVLAEQLSGRLVVVDETCAQICDAWPPGWEAAGEELPTLDHAVLADAVRRSQDLGRSIEYPGPHHSRAVTAIGGTTLQGGMVLDTRTPPSAASIRTLERGAMIAALVLLSRERVAAAEHRAMNDLVTAIIKEGAENEEGLARTAARYGVDSWDDVHLIAADAPALTGANVVERARDALGSVRALIGSYSGDLLVLAPAKDPGALAESLQRALNRGGNAVSIVISAPIGRLAAVPATYGGVRRCLSLLSALDRRGDVVTTASLSPYAVLFSGRERVELDAFVEHNIGVLLEHDRRRRSSELARTLLVYLDHGHDTPTTAAKLHVHQNTLRQRLATATRLAPDWRDPRRSLEVHLALRLARLREGLPADVPL